MWCLVNRYNGIPLTLTSNHYTWTYGPTAIFTVVVSLWKQVNYCTMVSQPWHELHNGPQEAAQTVLLDYIWPLQITSFTKALKNRHLAVATSILIFTLLRLVMVVSTTLFVLEDTSFSQNIQAQLVTKFNATKYRDSILGSKSIVTSDPVWDYLDLREEHGDAPPPVELSMAFTNYSISSEIHKGADKVSVQVDAFQVNTTCETTTVHWSQNLPARFFNLTLKTPSCDIGTIEIAACNSQNALFCRLGSRYFQSGWVGCRGQGFDVVNFGDPYLNADEYRLAIVTIESDVTLVSDQETYPGNYSVNVRRIAAVSCGLQYSIHQGVAHGPAFDTNKVDSLEITNTHQSQIDNLTGSDILDAMFISASNANTTNTSLSIALMDDGRLDLLGLLMGSRTIVPTTFDPLLDVSSLKNKAEVTFNGLSHQLMRRYFLLPADVATAGSIHCTERRLYTRQAALWAMVGLLAFISCLVLLFAVYSKQGVAPHSPATLANAAYTMSRSPTTGRLLKESNLIRLSDIRKCLANYDFFTVGDRTGMLRVEAVAVSRKEASTKSPGFLARKWESTSWKRKSQSPDPKPRKKGAWMPYSSHRHAIALTLILPATAIGTLEILRYLSDNNEHFVTVASDASIAAYAIRYSSIAIVLIISTLFNTLDFAIATMTSFSALAIGGATAERTIQFTILGDLPPVALYKTIYHMHIGATLSLVASTIGSLLTIAISGLWVETAIEISRNVTVEVQSDWNVGFTGTSINTFLAGIVEEDTIALFNDVEHGVPDKATLIWGNVVLPRVGNPQPSITSQLKETSEESAPEYHITVPAVRPFLECSELPSSAIHASADLSNDGLRGHRWLSRTFEATATLPAGCVDPYSSAEQSDTISFSDWFDDYNNNTSGWVGWIFDLSVILKSDKAPAEGCPSLGAIYGTYEGAEQPHLNLTALICTQHLQLVQANVPYPADMSFTPNLTKQVHLNSIPPKNIVDSQSGSSSLGTEISESFYHLEVTGPVDDKIQIDPFFSRIIGGQTAIERESLLGSENVDTVIAAMNDLYQKFMVRVVDLEWRRNTGGENSTQYPSDKNIAPGYMTVTTKRLKINKTSKIVLQTILGTMVLLGGAAWWCVDMRVLPRNPYPIASSMALFAGSRLIGASGHSPDGSREQEQQWRIKRKPLVVLKGGRFRLGWWDGSNAVAGDSSGDDPASHALLSSTERRRFGIDVEDISKASTGSRTDTVVFRKRKPR
ncbi:hypothetical protein F4808DRAFT_468624 [Astrocystis sublimbata]|nr:hypothetical protein F4808DRAFT_468624 [Astrocystis sublimbata]